MLTSAYRNSLPSFFISLRRLPVNHLSGPRAKKTDCIRSVPMPTKFTEAASPRHELQNHARSAERFALVQDAHMVSAWNTYEEAVQEGYRVFGLEPFLVREFRTYDPRTNSEA
jgi:hypothetical protein